MLLIVSPSKTQEMKGRTLEQYSLPALLKKSELLARRLSMLSRKELAELMKISPKLAESTFERFQQFTLPFSLDNARQALLVFRGDQFSLLDINRYTDEEFAFAQDHLRILSGLYGVLRPLDLIQPYRLEMATKLATENEKTLYGFWNGYITDHLRDTLALLDEPVLVNLASDEYYRALQPDNLGYPVVKITFKEIKEGKPRVVAIHAKRARGMMVDFVIRHRLIRPGMLKDFTGGGYRYSEDVSTGQEWVFTRLQQ